MNRSILCPACHLTFLRSLGRPIVQSPVDNSPVCLQSIGPEEHHKSVTGKLTHACFCDICDRVMFAGELATARSVWVVGHGIPYYAWESEYIDVDNSPSDFWPREISSIRMDG